MLHRANRRRCAHHDYIDVQAHKLGSKLGKKRVSAFGKAPFDDEILSLDEPKLAHAA